MGGIIRVRKRLPAALGKREKGAEMYVAIRRYELDPGASVDELMQRVNEGFIPLIKDASGFLAYYALDSGGGTVTTVSVFEDREGAEESNRLAADWVGRNLALMLPNPPEVMAGEVGAHEAGSTGPVSAVTDTVGGATDTLGGVTDAARNTLGGVTDAAGGVTGGLLGGGGREEREGDEPPRRR